jgi:enoyl-CoA hydratase
MNQSPMNYENLLLSESDGIITLTINREKALNALNKRTMEELAHFFGTAAADRKDIKGVILRGAGDKAFVAGADIKEFLDLEGDGAAMAKKGQDVFFLIERFHRPVVAAVTGFALGGGCELALACHLRIAGEKARFGQPEVKLGIIPGYGGTQRLVQLIGKTKALELMLTADMIDAQEAYRLGLVNDVVAAGEEESRARGLLERISANGPVAVQKVIQAVNAYFQYDTDGFATEVSTFGETTQTEDFREGAMAFIEKRKADFQGK